MLACQGEEKPTQLEDSRTQVDIPVYSGGYSKAGDQL